MRHCILYQQQHDADGSSSGNSLPLIESSPLQQDPHSSLVASVSLIFIGDNGGAFKIDFLGDSFPLVPLVSDEE